MKKTFSMILAVAMVLGVACVAGAATTVSVTLTSPTITGSTAAGTCEKAGAVTFSFPAGSILTAGDWWYMDLPTGVTLCKPIDYLIVSDGVNMGTPNAYVGVSASSPTTVWFNNDALAITDLKSDAAGGGGSVTDAGPLSVSYNGIIANLGQGVVASAGSKFAFRVVGAQGSHRVTIYLAGDDATVTGGGTLTVQPDNVLNIKILDGNQYNTKNADGSDTRIITDIDKKTYDSTDTSKKNTAGTGNYTMYGQSTADGVAVDHNENIGSFPVATKNPFDGNTLCVSAPGLKSNLNVSFASKQDKFTFTGDSQIAHVGAAAEYTLSSCVGKTTNLDTIHISKQNSCTFDYETDGKDDNTNNYCKTHAAGKIYLTSSSTFGDLNDLFDIQFQSMTPGVYFSNTADIYGLTSNQKVCEDQGTKVATTNDFCTGTTCFDADNSISFPDSSCSVTDKKKIDIIKTTDGGIDQVFNYNTLAFDFANFVYDNSVVSDGVEVKVKVTLSKYPCGNIFSDTISIGSFVSTCGTTAGATTLLFPYLPGSKYPGWWGGYVITNGSTTAGTADLTIIDENGNKATFTTPSIGPGKFYNATGITADMLTQDGGNSANVDFKENFVVEASCNFGSGAGFAFLGNGTEGTGYVAESSAW
jgi:hypothetical protein